MVALLLFWTVRIYEEEEEIWLWSVRLFLLALWLETLLLPPRTTLCCVGICFMTFFFSWRVSSEISIGSVTLRGCFSELSLRLWMMFPMLDSSTRKPHRHSSAPSFSAGWEPPSVLDSRLGICYERKQSHSLVCHMWRLSKVAEIMEFGSQVLLFIHTNT